MREPPKQAGNPALLPLNGDIHDVALAVHEQEDETWTVISPRRVFQTISAFSFGPLELHFLVGAQIFSGPIDVEVEHGHGEFERVPFRRLLRRPSV